MNGLDLKLERIRRGVKQYQLAAALELPQTTLSNIENGRRGIDPEQVLTITNTLRELAARTRRAEDDRVA